MNKYLLVGIVSILIIAGGWWYLNQSSTSSTLDTTQLPVQQNPTTGSNSNTTQQSTIASKSGWVVTTNQQLGIRFENPADASVSSLEQRKTTDATTINELIVTPKGTDPTIVHFFSTNVSLEKAKNIQIYQSDIRNSEFSDVTIDGLEGVRRTDHYSNNNCTKELTVVEKGGIVYGSHIVQCPTHPQGYDQLRRDISNSLKLL